jgi:hypothetical protein
MWELGITGFCNHLFLSWVSMNAFELFTSYLYAVFRIVTYEHYLFVLPHPSLLCSFLVSS